MRLFGDTQLLKRNFPQLLAVITGTLSAISDGMQYGWTSPVIPILESPNTPVPIQLHDVVWLENIYMIGSFAGLPLTIYCVERFGRKKSILIASVHNLVGWIIIAFASSVESLYVARFIMGLAGDVAFVSAPMYIAEIADQSIRGFLGCLIYLMMLIGILVVYSVAPFVSILVSSGVGATFVCLQLLTFPFMPETPYYFLLKGKTEEARKSLQRLRSTEDVEAELEEISTAIQRQKSERGRPIDLLKIPSNRKALLVMTVLNAAQHFSSISVMLMNIHTILGDAASILTPSTAAIVFSVIMLLAASLSACLIDKAGRKILLSTSSLLTGLSLLVLASYFWVKNSGTDISSYTWVPVVAVMVYAGAFKYGLGIVPIVMTGELFPTGVKAMGISFANAMYVIFSLISIYMYQKMVEGNGMHVPFFIFAGCCLLTAVFTIFVIPETKGKTLEEIQHILKGKKYMLENHSATTDIEAKNTKNAEDTVL